MKFNYILYGLVALIIISTVLFTFLDVGTVSNDDYKKKIEAQREEKNEFFRTSDESPIKDKANFKGLSYFEPDEKYKVKAKLVVLENRETYTMKMSKGEAENFLKYAYIYFDLGGKNHKLLVLKRSLQDKILFIAFKDESSGKTSYGGGRYLDCAIASNQLQELTIDFNLAYNPYCVYNEDFTCPIPPKENTLGIEIKAGEKYEE